MYRGIETGFSNGKDTKKDVIYVAGLFEVKRISKATNQPINQSINIYHPR